MIMDNTQPQIQEQFVTPSGKYYCVKATDDVGIKNVFVNGKLIKKWAGSYNYYCDTTQNLNGGKIIYGTNSLSTRESTSIITYSSMENDIIFKAWSIIAVDMGWHVDYKTYQDMIK